MLKLIKLEVCGGLGDSSVEIPLPTRRRRTSNYANESSPAEAIN
jgi:hypothetical protein